MWMCGCACACTCTCARVCACARACARTRVCICSCVCACVCKCMCACVHVHVCMCMRMCVYRLHADPWMPICPARAFVSVFVLFCVPPCPYVLKKPFTTRMNPFECTCVTLLLISKNMMLGEISPVIRSKTCHLRWFLSLFVSFLCLPVPLRPNAPIQTHTYPFPSICTRQNLNFNVYIGINHKLHQKFIKCTVKFPVLCLISHTLDSISLFYIYQSI